MVTAVENATVKLEDGVTVNAEEITVEAVIAEDSVTILPSVENATTSADIVDVTPLEPAKTLAVLAPATIEIAPDVTEVIVGLEDRVTVATEDSATVLLVSVT